MSKILCNFAADLDYSPTNDKQPTQHHIVQLTENNIQSVFFLGIGGIGMSALARYFASCGYRVGGYDRTESPLTQELVQEGLSIFYQDEPKMIPDWAQQPIHCLVVRTPAVPADNQIYQYFVAHDYDIRKRAEVLGLVTRQRHALCVAGTHGKTTTSTLIAHLMYQSEIGTNAFLGGISQNYKTNLLIDKNSDYVVVEADEYDRSFHHLTPYMSVITSADADHLDIYGTEEAYRQSFEHYASLVQNTLVIKHGLPLAIHNPKAKVYTYAGAVATTSTSKPDFYADNVRVQDGNIYLDFVTPTQRIQDMRLGVPVWVNVENSVAAMAIAWLNGVTEQELRLGLSSFRGVQRRFNIHVNTPHVAYVDDYAHHPAELEASIQSIRRLYPERHFIAVFQPHLYTRTRDFYKEFARVLHQADELILLPIYPARELPIPGVTSEMLKEAPSNSPSGEDKNGMRHADIVVEKADAVAYIAQRVSEIGQPVVIATLGAGDIDRLVEPLKNQLTK